LGPRIEVRLAAPQPDAGGRLPPGPRAACVVVVDVLRATTTLTVALGNGAREVLPFARPEDAMALRRGRDDVLACGEREGRIVPGFDLGNSPFEYTPERVSGKRLAFASTNGAMALLWAKDARRRVLAAFVNLSAVVERVVGERHVVIVCAGKLGRFALEDAACAGLLVGRLLDCGAALEGAAARAVHALAPRDVSEIRALVEGSAHGRYLRRLGPALARDLEFCARLDSLATAFAT
jgi:2-phosphosulfolactate phosphatase